MNASVVTPRYGNSTEPPKTMPRSITVYIAILAFLAGGVALAGLQGQDRPFDDRIALALAFVPLLVLAESMMVRFRYRDQIDGCNLFEAALAPVIFAYPTVTVMAVVAAAQAINGLVRRNHPVKATFNVVQWSLAAGVGSVVFTRIGSGHDVTSKNLVTLAFAMLIVVALNVGAFTLVMQLAQREPLRRIIAALGPVYSLGLAAQAPVNLTLGLLLAAAYEWSPGTILLFPLPLVMLYWAFRSHTAALTERSRAAGVRSAVRALGERGADETIPRFLAHVLSGFDAQAAELVLVEKHGRVIHHVATGDPPDYRTRREPADAISLSGALLASDRPLRITKDSGDMLASLLREQGWRDCLAAPLPIDGRVGGVLCIFNRSGFDGTEPDELAILEGLAGETATVRRTSVLENRLHDQRRLGDMINRTTDGLAGISADGMIKMWNPALEQITGYSAEEMINTRQIGVLRPRDEEGLDVMLEHWSRGRGPFPATVQIRTRSGEVRWLSCTKTILPGSDGQAAMMILSVRDATRSREIEQLKDEFAATVSHELRAPLTPIKGWAETLLLHGDRVTAREREEGVRRILVQAEHLERIIEGLLEMAKIEGGEKGRFEPVDVVPVLDHVIEEIELEHPARKVRFKRAGTLAHPRGNDGWIAQIVRNLLTNAVKYSPATEPVEVAIGEVPGGVTISVTDHGNGISVEDQQVIFERYQRLERGSGKPEGVGLGLHIASQLARAMDGSLTVTSTPGRGSTFTLVLPAATKLSVVG